MLVIGEKINTSRQSVEKAVKERNKEFIQNLARQQLDQGADVLDINVGSPYREQNQADMKWLTKAVQEISISPLCLDNPDPEVLLTGCEVYNFEKARRPILNSAAPDRAEAISNLLQKYPSQVIALVSEKESIKEKSELARFMASSLGNSVPREDIFIDVGVKSIGVDSGQALLVVEAVQKIKELGLKTICAPSNISFGFTGARRLLNQVFIKTLQEFGIDAVICNPVDIGAQLSPEDLEVTRRALEGKDRRFKEYRKYLKEKRQKEA